MSCSLHWWVLSDDINISCLLWFYVPVEHLLLTHEPSQSKIHFSSSSMEPGFHGISCHGCDLALSHSIHLPSWDLTYPLTLRHFWVDDFLNFRGDMWSCSLEGITLTPWWVPLKSNDFLHCHFGFLASPLFLRHTCRIHILPTTTHQRHPNAGINIPFVALESCKDHDLDTLQIT